VPHGADADVIGHALFPFRLLFQQALNGRS
jgi:hypothetical protein